MKHEYGFYTKIAGVTFEGRQKYVARLFAGEELKIVREPNNQHDPNAIAVYNLEGNQLGYINRDLAKNLADQLDRGIEFKVYISSITGGDAGQNYGANIYLKTSDLKAKIQDTNTSIRKVWDY